MDKLLVDELEEYKRLLDEIDAEVIRAQRQKKRAGTAETD